MKKYLGLALCALFCAGMISCAKSGPAGDAKKIYKDMLSITVNATGKLEKSADGKEAGDALIEYATAMKTLADQSKELQKKYPDFDEKSSPELKSEQAEMLKEMKNFSAAMTAAMMKHSGSKDLMNAVMKMSQIMSDSAK